ncbi:hypothetical protein BFP76_08275 [Amylibacter kogurei]|uniref:Uncharacterized protein n=1 Tax=Paramylibacter kogurei TaxID=1889778 RepID=A0A2G5K291_9RHOB|nr:hypothetical protein [Amylibacter kogurei]PIB23525.1 hypothetical protein BFP76_08275 [Amylibacter kogurei]
MSIQLAAIRAAVVLIPSYSVAYLTEKMVYVVPMLAAASFFAGALEVTPVNTRRRVEEDDVDTDLSSDAMTNEIWEDSGGNT